MPKTTTTAGELARARYEIRSLSRRLEDERAKLRRATAELETVKARLVGRSLAVGEYRGALARSAMEREGLRHRAHSAERAAEQARQKAAANGYVVHLSVSWKPKVKPVVTFADWKASR